MPIPYPFFVQITRTPESDTDISPLDTPQSLQSILLSLFSSPSPTDRALTHIIRTLAKYVPAGGITEDRDIEVLLAVSVALAKKI